MNDQDKHRQSILMFDRIAIAMVLVVGLLAGYAIGDWGHTKTKDQLTALQVANAQGETAIAHAGYERLEAAVIRSNYLERALVESETQLRKLSEEKRHAVKAHTTGRTCLNADAVRVLNAETVTAADGMPGTVGDAPAAGRPIATDSDDEAEEVATDDDVAGWSVTVKEQFGVCRERLQRLIDWFPIESTQPH